MYNKYQDNDYVYQSQLDGLLAWFEIDDNVRYNLSEFLQIMCSQIKNPSVRENAWGVFMHGTDGFIHANDIVLTMNLLYTANITMEYAERLVKKGNPGTDKKLCFIEFSRMMQWK